MMRDSRSGRTSEWVFPLLCVVMGIVVLYLAYQNVQLKKRLAEVVARSYSFEDTSRRLLGETARPFAALLPDGQELAVRTDSLSAPIILAWLSYHCDPCEMALEKWNLLADEFPGRLFGVARTAPGEGDPAFAGRNVRFPILTPISDTIFDIYQVVGTPLTMVILEHAIIGHVCQGPLDEETYGRVRDLMQPIQ